MIFIPTSKGVPGPRGLKGERGPGGPQVCSKIVVSVVRGRDCCGSRVFNFYSFGCACV